MVLDALFSISHLLTAQQFHAVDIIIFSFISRIRNVTESPPEHDNAGIFMS
jgi:hypothetical protein